jgi:hypothetical protein
MDDSQINVGVLGTGVGKNERKGAWEAVASILPSSAGCTQPMEQLETRKRKQFSFDN